MRPLHKVFCLFTFYPQVTDVLFLTYTYFANEKQLRRCYLSTLARVRLLLCVHQDQNLIKIPLERLNLLCAPVYILI